MTFIPTPKKIIITLVEEPVKEGVIIVPHAQKAHSQGVVIAVGEKTEFTSIGDVVLFNQYIAVQLDEKEKTYILEEAQVICKKVQA